MARLCKRRRPPWLKVGFEVRRDSQDVLGRAYQRLLPLRTCPLSSSVQATTSKGGFHESPASESRPGPGEPAGRALCPGLLRPIG
jgi:hypothetical protein